MGKLHLLQLLMKDGLVAHLTREELCLFLLMVAASNEHGEGEILPGQLRQALGKDFSPRGLKGICTGLAEKGLVVTMPIHRYCAKRCSIVITYRIILPGYAELKETEFDIGLQAERSKEG